ncbi:hypothetical protein J3R30DRAFT_224846 [Lentinula aciculospora]|uniref:F-box domain-containing protein n=1 Tax=Lentinula aciculospora TaxID=153920 RepID=A0A9W9AAG5_9AGAR|nr:hypothetical protein J3R30DRAFT_224846 [Lentinula aciculospora]
MTATVIPVELAEAIINFLYDDPKTLATCSLVCSAWVARTRHLLFWTVHLDSSSSEAFINLLLHPCSTILRHIYRLGIDCSSTSAGDTAPCHSRKIPSEDYLLPFDRFLSAFKRITDLRAIHGTDIQCLRLSNLDWTAYPLQLQSRITTTLARLFPKTTSLGLDQVVLHDMRQLNVSVLRAFPGLERLEARLKFLKYFEYPVALKPGPGKASKLPTGLKEIELVDEGMTTVLGCIAQNSSDSETQDALNVHSLSLKGCTPEMVPCVSGALHALSGSLKTLRLSFLDNRFHEEPAFLLKDTFECLSDKGYLQSLHLDDINLTASPI